MEQEIKTLTGLVGELRLKFEDFEKGRLTRADFDEYKGKVGKDIDDIQTKLNRPPVPAQVVVKENGPSVEMKAFEKMNRRGPQNLNADEVKVLQIGDQTLGGYLAPGEYVREIIKGIILYSPMRSYARVRTTTASFIEIPKKTGASTAKWTYENEAKTETTGIAFGMEKLEPQEMYSLYKASKKSLDDSAFNLEEEIRLDASEQQGKLEGTGFITGDGIGKPEGILSNAALITAKVAGAGGSGVLGVADIFALHYSLPAVYAQNGVWLMNRLTEKACMLLKDTNNFYLWMPSLATGQPSTLLGRPIASTPDMPDIAGGAYAMAFGDFQRGYTIVDRQAMELQRLVELYAEAGQIGFIVNRRVTGRVTLSEAIKILAIQS